MDPLTITLALLAAWGVTKLLSGGAQPTGFPVVVPPDPNDPWPTQTPPGALCPPNLPPPPDVTVLAPPYPQGLTLGDLGVWATKQLKYPKGTRVIDVVDGQLLIGRLEWHYHPPGTPGVTATGCHKGCTVYLSTVPWTQIAGDLPPNTNEA